jgi:hypothetical protein
MAGEETAAQRFARDWSSQEADRKTRGLDSESTERKSRLYVDSNVSAVTGGAPIFS